MKALVSIVRPLLSAAAIAVAGYAFLAGHPLAAEDPGPGCEYGTPTGDFRCTTAKRHIYDEICEGNDCYYILEECCEFAT